jgi:hypothetical protein
LNKKKPAACNFPLSSHTKRFSEFPAAGISRASLNYPEICTPKQTNSKNKCKKFFYISKGKIGNGKFD